VTYVKGIHNIKIGGTFEHTFLTENDTFGIVNPGLLAGCTSAACVTLQPYDLTNPATDPTQAEFLFHGHTDIKEEALYAQDTLTMGPWSITIGLRGDFYNGLQARTKQAEPRAGIAYNIKKTGTVIRTSYARSMESPFNENLIISGTGCNTPAVAAVMQLSEGFPCGEVSPSGAILPLNPLTPGFRNEFHAGLEQAFGKHFVLSGEYIWKYTHNGYDFNILGTSPITLPIEWASSKIPGYALRGNFPTWHGFTAFVVMSSVAARFFPPTVSGIAPPQPPGVFRIDHDEHFNQTTHLQYQPFKRGPWLAFNWRYDSGLVSGPVPCLAATATCSFSTGSADSPIAVHSSVPVPAGDVLLQNNATGLALTADQEFEAGLSCGGQKATPTSPIGTQIPGFPGFYTCPANQLTSNLVKIPAPGTENDDHNPQRIQPRNLFDVALGHDNIFHGDRYKWSARLEVINLTDKEAVYNFLSTFSGTHYVSPRTITGTIGFHF
jgi:outer membrane receptor protein involved in Fe transport